MESIKAHKDKFMRDFVVLVAYINYDSKENKCKTKF